MTTEVADVLRDIIRAHGRPLADDPRRVEAMLRDLAGEHRREISVLVGAAREGVPAELMSSRGAVPAAVLEERLARTLQDNLGLSEDAARWAVTTWAAALTGAGTAASSSAVTPTGSSSTSVPSLPSLPGSAPLAVTLSEAGVTDRLLALPLDESGDLAWAVLGLLAVADGPLAMSDVAGMLRQPVRQVHRAIAPVADLIVRDGRLEAGGEPFRRAVTGYLGQAEQDSQRHALVRWCAERVAFLQPGHETPEYILRHGGGYFAAAGDVGVLSQIVDREWMRQSAARTGSLTGFVRDMSRAADTAVAQRPPDRRLELRATLAGVTAAAVAADVPSEAIGVLAAAGQAERALDLAALVTPWWRSDAYYLIASALHSAGAAEAADTAVDTAIAAGISDARGSGDGHALHSLVSAAHRDGMSGWALRALAALRAEGPRDQYSDSLAAQVLAAAGDAGGALRAARNIDNEFSRDSALDTAVIALAQAGRTQDAIEAALDVRRNAGALTGKIAAITAERGDVKATMAAVDSAPDDNFRQWVVIQAGKVWAQAGRPDDIDALMKTIANPENRRHAAREVATVLAGAGQASRAVSMWTAVAAEEDKEYGLVDLAKATAEAGDFDDALRIASAVTDDYRRRGALTHVAAVIARTGDVPRATAIVDTIEDEYDRSSMLADVAKDLTAHDLLDDAVTVAGMITRPVAKAESQVAVASALAAAGDYQRSAALAAEAAEVTSRGGAAHVGALLVQARALALAGRPGEAATVAERAVGTAHETHDQRILADALATRSMVLATWSGHQDQAAAAGREAVALIRRDDVLDGSDDAFMQDRRAESIAAILAEAGPPDLVIDAALSIADDYHRDKALTEAATALARRGLADHAVEAARNASSFLGSPYEAEEKLKEIARVLARLGHGEGALRAVAALADIEGIHAHIEYDQASMVCEVARILAESGHVETACDTARASVPSWNRSAALTAAACAVAAGDPRLAAEIAGNAGSRSLAKVAEALAAAGRIGDALPLADDAIQRALAAVPRLPPIMTALDSLEQLAEMTGDQATTEREVATQMTGSERDAAARQAVRQARAITDPVQRAHAEAAAAIMLARSPDPELRAEALAQAGQVRQDARRLQDLDRAHALGAVARALAACGESAMAAETAQECLATGSYGAELAIDVLADIGQLAGALAAIGALELDADKARVFLDLAGRLAETGQAGDLRRLVDETGVLDLIADTQDRVSALTGLGVVLAVAGEAAAASRLAEDVTALARELAEDREKALAHADLAELLAALGRQPEALEQARQALTVPREALGGWWGAMATKAVKVLVECEQVADAVAVVKAAPAAGRTESAVTVAAALFAAGQQDHALRMVDDEFAAARTGGRRDAFYDLLCEHLPRYPDLLRAWLGDGTEIAQVSAELAAIEQWWAQ